MAYRPASTSQSRYLAFELAVLRRLTFDSAAIPFAGRPELGWYLKLWRKRVLVNDLALWSWWSSRALVENGTERLREELVLALVEGLAPAVERSEDGLGRWLEPADAAWFRALRHRVEALETQATRALATRAALLTLDFALSVPPGPGRSRPLASVFAELARNERPPIDNGPRSVSANVDAETFLSRARADLLYVSFPGPEGVLGWRDDARGLYETWLRGGEHFWGDLAAAQTGRFGGRFESKRAYLEAVDRFLGAAAPFPILAVLFPETGWLIPQEIADRISSHRRVRVAYSRDFTAVARGRRVHLFVAE